MKLKSNNSTSLCYTILWEPCATGAISRCLEYDTHKVVNTIVEALVLKQGKKETLTDCLLDRMCASIQSHKERSGTCTAHTKTLVKNTEVSYVVFSLVQQKTGVYDRDLCKLLGVKPRKITSAHQEATFEDLLILILCLEKGEKNTEG